MLERLLERRSVGSWSSWDSGGPSPGSGSSCADEWAPWYAATAYLADRVSMLPVDQYRSKPDGTREAVPTSPVFADPDTGSRIEWVWQLVHELVNEGVVLGVARPQRDAAGRPLVVDWIPRSNWNATREGGALVVRVNGVAIPYGDWYMRRWRPKVGMPAGLSPKKLFDGVIETGLSADEYLENWYEHGGHPTMVVEYDGDLDPKQSQVIKDRVTSIMRRNREPLVLGKRFKATPWQESPAGSEEHMKFLGSQACRILGLRPEVLGYPSGNSMSYSNIESASIDELTHTHHSLLVRAEELMSSMTVRGQFVKLNTAALLMTDTLTRYQVHQIAISSGMNNVDERRRLEDEAPLPKGLGQVYRPIDAPMAPAQKRLFDVD